MCGFPKNCEFCELVMDEDIKSFSEEQENGNTFSIKYTKFEMGNPLNREPK